jgi:hypothetical protein
MKALKSWIFGLAVTVVLFGASASQASAQVVVRAGPDHPHHHHRHHSYHHYHHN